MFIELWDKVNGQVEMVAKAEIANSDEPPQVVIWKNQTYQLKRPCEYHKTAHVLFPEPTEVDPSQLEFVSQGIVRMWADFTLLGMKFSRLIPCPECTKELPGNWIKPLLVFEEDGKESYCTRCGRKYKCRGPSDKAKSKKK